MKGYSKVTLAAVAAGIAAAVLARSEYEKKHLEIAEYEIASEKIGKAWDHCSIVFLSDLHGNEFGKANQELIKQICRLKPQLILIGGDLSVVKARRKKDFSKEKKLLDALTSICPVYYAMGNHEQRMQKQTGRFPGWWEEYCRILDQTGVLLLDNDGVILEREGQKISIDGLSLKEVFFRKRIQPKKLFPNVRSYVGPCERNCFEILLAHSPLFVKQYAQWGADLILSGHFHGGTVYLPYMGGLMTPQFHFFSPLCRGKVQENEAAMIVSAGLGTHSINLRLNNKPQLVHILLKAKPDSYTECII